MDEQPERVLTERVGCLGGRNRHCDDRRPAGGLGKAPVLIAALDPGDTEARVRRADHAGDINADLDLADLRKGIVGAGIVVQGKRALRAGEVIRSEPDFADATRVGGTAADLLDEAVDVERDTATAQAGSSRE